MTLHNLGCEVLAVDSDEDRVAQALTDQIAAHAVELDSTQPCALKEAGIFDFETVIVAIGNYVEESVITTMNLKEANVPHVIAKASSEIHKKLLKKVGADRVVFPEHEMGSNLARALTRGVLDRFELDPNNSIVEMMIPEEFDGKTIAELQLRNRYGLTVLAIGSEDCFQINPEPDQHLKCGMVMVVLGANKHLDRLPILSKNGQALKSGT